jgi:hypothetical protein
MVYGREGVKARITDVSPEHNNHTKLTIATKGDVSEEKSGGIGRVWSLFATEQRSFGFGKLFVKPSRHDGNESVYWLPVGIYMVEHWDGKRDHRTYVKVNEFGDVVAQYSLTLELDYRRNGFTEFHPLRATFWIREQFPKGGRA